MNHILHPFQLLNTKCWLLLNHRERNQPRPDILLSKDKNEHHCGISTAGHWCSRNLSLPNHWYSQDLCFSNHWYSQNLSLSSHWYIVARIFCQPIIGIARIFLCSTTGITRILYNLILIQPGSFGNKPLVQQDPSHLIGIVGISNPTIGLAWILDPTIGIARVLHSTIGIVGSVSFNWYSGDLPSNDWFSLDP